MLAVLLIPSHRAGAQSSLEMLQKDLDQFKQEHQEASSKNMDSFFGALAEAEGSPDAAQKLYLAAGGKLPEGARVMTHYEHETPTEEDARKALDQASMASFNGTLQLHCGMMRMAALFVTQPKLPTLQSDWLTWLKNAAQTYPQIVVSIADPRLAGADGERIDASAPIRNFTMRESPIGTYLGFQKWGDKKPGAWRLAAIPKLYFDQILTPLRKTPTPETLAAWDTYIAMMNADEPDQDKWTNVDYPPLQFQKACDDYAAKPGTDKLEALVNLIKAHPTYPQLDDWISQVHDMIQAYQVQRSAAETPNPNAPPAQAPVAPDSPPGPAVSTPSTATTVPATR